MLASIFKYRFKFGLLLICIGVAALLLPTLSNSYVLGDYVINKEYYATVLCINKNKPKLECNGKCSLISKLNNNQNQPINNTEFLKKQFEILWVHFESPIQQALVFYGVTNAIASASNKPFGFYSADVFRPPCI